MLAKDNYRGALAELLKDRSEYSKEDLCEIIDRVFIKLEKIESETMMVLKDQVPYDINIDSTINAIIKYKKVIEIIKKYFDIDIVDESADDEYWQWMFITSKKDKRYISSGRMEWEEIKIMKEVFE